MPVKFWQRAAALAAWIVVWQLAAFSLGHGGLFLATPIQTLQALAQLVPTAGFWQRIVFSALRILTGFLLAVVGGLVLGALGARWRWVFDGTTADSAEINDHNPILNGFTLFANGCSQVIQANRTTEEFIDYRQQ